MKRSRHLEPLSHDHYAGLQVARRLRSGLDHGADPKEMRAFVVHFWDTYLVEHFRQEEELLLAPLDQSGGAVFAERLVDEHRRLERLAEECRSGTANHEVISSFRERLKAHIRFEERMLFPHLEERLEPEALRKIGVALHDRHVDVDLSWPTPFWVP